MAIKITQKKIIKDKIVVYVLGYWAKNMIAPTQEEIRQHLGISKAYVNRLVKELLDEGALKRADVGTARSLVVPKTKIVYDDGTDIIYSEDDLK